MLPIETLFYGVKTCPEKYLLSCLLEVHKKTNTFSTNNRESFSIETWVDFLIIIFIKANIQDMPVSKAIGSVEIDNLIRK